MKCKLLVVTLALTTVLNGCSDKGDIVTSEVPMEYLSGCSSINPNDYGQLVGDADYTFVGQVVEDEGTVYIDETVYYDENGEEIERPSDASEENATPYTHYKVRIVKNIKGELLDTELVNIFKYGGLTHDGKANVIFENDVFPDIDKYYIFNAYAQADGTLHVVGENSNVVLEDVDTDLAVEHNSEYKEMELASENQKETPNTHEYTADVDVLNTEE